MHLLKVGVLLAFSAYADVTETAYPNVLGSASYTHHKGGTVECSGHLFGFSGMDGTTEEAAGFVGVFVRDFSLDFCALSTPRSLHIRSGQYRQSKIVAATGDVLLADVSLTNGAGFSRLSMLWVNDRLLAGLLPADDNSRITLSPSYLWSDETEPTVQCHVSSGDEDVLALCYTTTPAGTPFALARSTSNAAAAVSLAKTAVCVEDPCTYDMNNLTESRLAPYASLPKVSSEYQALLSKALSVMRVNTLSREGGIRQHWSTPDRTPHRWMWLWDSCYHSMGVNLLTHPSPTSGVTLGWESLKSFLASADSAGGDAIMRTPQDDDEVYTNGKEVHQTQPPLLAWAVWENYLAAKEAGVDSSELLRRLRYAAPKLEAYLEWDMHHRGDLKNRTPLLFWSKGTESGMDNSQRFDDEFNLREMAAVDFSVFVARDATFVAKICRELGKSECEAKWDKMSRRVSSAVHSMLWNEKNGLYFDKVISARESTFSDVKAVSGLLPMWLNDMPKERMPKLLAAIRDPNVFGTKVPLASVAKETEGFSTDMWRGPMWVNTNYMVSLALLERKEKAEAIKLIIATLDCVNDNYKKYGVIFEFYDADGMDDPRVLLRKGMESGGVRDYHWSAALTFKMIMLLHKMHEEPNPMSLLMRRHRDHHHRHHHRHSTGLVRRIDAHAQGDRHFRLDAKGDMPGNIQIDALQ
mmetsp:Transcript_39838/g.70038  ORF Transcript_39838/g.70038 Transcript_39838/m.70038 type:complete len:694 (+) Transcript_39838:83-2164(+)